MNFGIQLLTMVVKKVLVYGDRKFITELPHLLTGAVLVLLPIAGSDSIFGRAEIWDALRAAAEAEINLAQLIVDSAGIIVQSEDLSTCYDERGQFHTL